MRLFIVQVHEYGMPYHTVLYMHVIKYVFLIVLYIASLKVLQERYFTRRLIVYII